MELQDKGSEITFPECGPDLHGSVPLPWALGPRQHLIKERPRGVGGNPGQERTFCGLILPSCEGGWHLFWSQVGILARLLPAG